MNKDNIPIEALEKVLDQLERQKIMLEVFYGFIDDELQIHALAQAAERIKNEME